MPPRIQELNFEGDVYAKVFHYLKYDFFSPFIKFNYKLLFRQLMWGDIRLGFDLDENAEYLENNERQTKTRTGININNIRLK